MLLEHTRGCDVGQDCGTSVQKAAELTLTGSERSQTRDIIPPSVHCQCHGHVRGTEGVSALSKQREKAVGLELAARRLLSSCMIRLLLAPLIAGRSQT